MNTFINMNDYIEIKGARVNNLKNIDIKIPRDKFVAITGVSGSGKSSLAFDTLYAEGQRRYVESLSAYARQFLGRKNKPECDFIKGIPPAIAIEQKSDKPQSTVYSRHDNRDLRISQTIVRTHRTHLFAYKRRRGEETQHRRRCGMYTQILGRHKVCRDDTDTSR